MLQDPAPTDPPRVQGRIGRLFGGAAWVEAEEMEQAELPQPPGKTLESFLITTSSSLTSSSFSACPCCGT